MFRLSYIAFSLPFLSTRYTTHFVKSKGLRIRFESLLVVLFGFLCQPEYVPTDVGREIKPDTFLDEIDAFVPAAHVRKYKALHT